LNGEAERLLALMTEAPPRDDGAPLRWQDKARILAMRDEGQSQEAIAEAIGCHQSTVSRTLADLDDSRPFARRMLDAAAAPIVQDIMDNLKTASMAEKTKMLAKLDVIREDKAEGTGAQFIVVVNEPGNIRSKRPVLDDAPATSAYVHHDSAGPVSPNTKSR
jgi:hypothetical protein